MMNEFQSAARPSRSERVSGLLWRRWHLLMVLLICGSFVPRAHAAPTPTPQSPAVNVIQHLQDTLLDVMKNAKALGYQGRYQKLEPVIKSAYALPTLAQLTLGQHWSSLSSTQQQTFVDTLSRLSIATYAARFDGYTSGETFRIVDQRKLGNGDAVVRSVFLKADGSKVTFDYILMPQKGNWRVINVVVDGVSDLALKRAQYSSVLKKSGFAGLIKKLDQKISAAAHGGSSS